MSAGPPAPALILGATFAAALGVTQVALASPLRLAQAGGGGEEGWNDARVTEIVARAIARRADWTGDLQDYQAQARGHIYFLYDLGRGSERHLIKADQLALEIFWRAPDRTRQMIVGHREEKLLPTDIRYHLDHLTVVLDNFGERIGMGEGAEVRDVPHPAAVGAPGFYDYRLADSLTLYLPAREVHVYRVDVRPRDLTAPGVVGAMYLDRESADIVKLEFTFTAASYVDETLDYINVHLDNALWEGRYWLPYRQGIELRREIEVLKFPAGSVIRAELQVRDYRFNTGLPAAFFRGAPVTTLPRSSLESFPFAEGLYDGLDPEVSTAPPSLEAIREEAARLVSESYLERMESLRLAVPGVSQVLRFRRAEGLYLGPGLSRGFPGGVELTLLGGYALGAGRWELEGRVAAPVSAALALEVAGYLDRTADAAPWPASSGAVGTLGALVDGEDYREPWWVSGGRLGVTWRAGATRGRVALDWERWESAQLEAGDVVDRDYRAVRELDEGEVVSLGVQMERPPRMAVEAVGGATWDARVEGATRALGSDFDYVQGAVRAEGYWPGAPGVRLSVAVGAAAGGRIPAQRLFPLGGRATVRGYDFHAFIGNVYATTGLELSWEIRRPYLSFAVFGDAGWAGVEGESAAQAVDVWNQVGAPAGPTRGVLVGVGAGLGLLFDIVRLDLARGLSERGTWQLLFRVRSDFWPWL